MLFILIEVVLLSKRGILYHEHYLKIIFPYVYLQSVKMFSNAKDVF